MPQTQPTTEGTTDTPTFQRSPRFADPANREAVLAGRIARKEARRLRKPGHRSIPEVSARADLCWSQKEPLLPYEGFPQTTDERRLRGNFYRLTLHPGVVVSDSEVKIGVMELPVKLMVEFNLPEGQVMEFTLAGGKTGVVRLHTGFRDDAIFANPETCTLLAATTVSLMAPCDHGQGFSIELQPNAR